MRAWGSQSVLVGSRWSAVMKGLNSGCRWSRYLFTSPDTCLDIMFHNVPPCSCPFVFPFVRACGCWCHFPLLIKVRWLSDSPPHPPTHTPLHSWFLCKLLSVLTFLLNACTPTHYTHTCANASRWWMVLLPAVLRGQKGAEREQRHLTVCALSSRINTRGWKDRSALACACGGNLPAWDLACVMSDCHTQTRVAVPGKHGKLLLFHVALLMQTYCFHLSFLLPHFSISHLFIFFLLSPPSQFLLIALRH